MHHRHARESWKPMTAGKARAIVVEMRRDTEPRAALRLFEAAAQMPQNFTVEARAIYAAEAQRIRDTPGRGDAQ